MSIAATLVTTKTWIPEFKKKKNRERNTLKL